MSPHGWQLVGGASGLRVREEFCLLGLAALSLPWARSALAVCACTPAPLHPCRTPSFLCLHRVPFVPLAVSSPSPPPRASVSLLSLGDFPWVLWGRQMRGSGGQAQGEVPTGRWACCAGSGNQSPSSWTPVSLCPPVCPVSSLALSASWRSIPPFLPGYIFSPTSNLWGKNGATSLVSLPPVPSVKLPFLSHSLGPWGGARGRRGPAQPPPVPLACAGRMREAD